MPIKQCDPVSLVEQAISRQDFGLGSRLLIEHSRDLLQPGRLSELKGLINRIPMDCQMENPKLMLISANADYQSGELSSAQRTLMTAIPVFQKLKDASSLSASYRYLAYIHQDMGDNLKAAQCCRRGLKILPPGDFRGRAGLLSALAGSQWRLMKYKPARQTYQKVMGIYVQAQDKEGQMRTLANSSAITILLGDLDTARREKEEVLRFYQDHGNRRSYCLAAVNLSSLYQETYQLEKAEVLLSSVLPEIQEMGMGMMIGPARLYLGVVQLLQGRYSEAEKTLLYALDKTDNARETSFYIVCCLALSRLYRIQKDFPLARKYGLQALESSSKERPLDRANAELNLAQLHLAGKDYRRAQSFNSKALVCFSRLDLKYKKALVLLTQAEIYFRQNKRPDFKKSFSQALKLCQSGGYDFFFDPGMPDNYWHLLAPYSAAQPPEAYSRKLADAFSPQNSLTEKELSADRIEIKALGNMILLINGQPVLKWKRDSARQILGILLARQLSQRTAGQDAQVQPVPGELIGLMLWPKKSLAIGSINLQVAVSELRRQLEPKLKDGKTSKFIEYHDNGYSLNLTDVSTDFQEFTGYVRKGQQAELSAQIKAALEFYRRAVELYRGDFLADFKVIDIEAPREHLRQLFYRAVLAVSRICLKQKQTEQAIRYAQMGIAKDRCLEEAHRILISAYHLQGRKDLMAKQYQKCRQALAKDLGLRISPETEELWNRLFKA